MTDTTGTMHARWLGDEPLAYEPVWHSMQQFTDSRHEHSTDEVWLLHHQPVFTLGQAGKPEHVLAPGNIPLIKVERGGQVTYHGPGQLVVYPLLDIGRRDIGVRCLVDGMEQAIIDTLANYGIEAARKKGAPGVYTGNAKIAALGLRIRKQRSFHGLALNIDMDTEPYSRINPCGFAGQAISQISDFDDAPTDLRTVGKDLLRNFCCHFDMPLPTMDHAPL